MSQLRVPGACCNTLIRSATETLGEATAILLFFSVFLVILALKVPSIVLVFFFFYIIKNATTHIFKCLI